MPYEIEADAIAVPSQYRGLVHLTKIAACRAALAQALKDDATQLHLHGLGTTKSIKREAIAKGVKPFIYWPSITTKIASFSSSIST